MRRNAIVAVDDEGRIFDQEYYSNVLHNLPAKDQAVISISKRLAPHIKLYEASITIGEEIKR